MLAKHNILTLALAAASVHDAAATNFHRQNRHIEPREIVYQTVVEYHVEKVYKHVPSTTTHHTSSSTTSSTHSTSSTHTSSAAPALVSDLTASKSSSSSSSKSSSASSTTHSTTSTSTPARTSSSSTSSSTRSSSSSSTSPSSSHSSTHSSSSTTSSSSSSTSHSSSSTHSSTSSSSSTIHSTTSSSTTSSSSSSSTSAAPTTIVPAHGSKRGAPFNDAKFVNTLVSKSKSVGTLQQASWAYNWDSSATGLDSSLEYIPMLWGAKHTQNWAANAQNGIANGATALLSCNEPDNSGQANMSPASAAQFHIANMNPFASKARIGSPAITSSQKTGQGLDWMTQFLTACNGKCVVDFCAMHWYGPGGTQGAQQFLNQVSAVHKGCQNRPVWVTEFGMDDSGGDEDLFLRTVLPALDSTQYAYVERYAAFYAAQGYMFLKNSTTLLSSWGNIYAGISQ